MKKIFLNSYLRALFLCILWVLSFTNAGCKDRTPVVPEQIEPGIYRIAPSRSNVYLLVGDTLALIDTGMPGEGKQILEAITAIGRKPEELTYILITHAHLDHIGSLALLKKATGATIVASDKEIGYIQGLKKTWRMSREGIGGKVFKALLFFNETFIFKYEPATIDIPCKGGETINCLGGIKVIDTPGHSPGSLSFYLPDKGILFTGDALSGRPALRLPMKVGCSNYQKALESVEKIAELTFEKCCFGHGDPVLNSADAQIRKLIKKK